MKLLTQTTRLHFFSSALVFLAAGVGLFFLLDQAVTEEIDENLALRAEHAFLKLKERQEPQDFYTWIEPIEGPAEEQWQFSDTLIYDSLTQEAEAFRRLVVLRNTGDNSYRLTLAASRVEWDDFLEVIGLVLGLATLLLLLTSTILTRQINRRVWRPFFSNLKILRNFSLRTGPSPTFSTSRIQEFQELADVLEALTQKARKDYHTLKEFTENASHEIQTPLAILQSRLEQLQQQEELGEQVHKTLASMQEVLSRLSRLNRNLLLLAKIDNHQFELKEAFNLYTLWKGQVEQMEELFSARNMKLRFPTFKSEVWVKGNQSLTETLLTNLLSNALRHGKKGETITIDLQPDSFHIQTVGPPLPFDEQYLFQRFGGGSEGTGLGLAICDAICHLQGWKITYRYGNGLHIFSVSFPL